MEKIIVLSDSHGNLNNMIWAVRQEKPDRIIHLGDCWGDSSRLQREYPQIPMDRVPGNCDYVQEPLAKILLIEGIRILICHGHMYQVKTDMHPLQFASQMQKVRVTLFGHTHKVYYDTHNGVTYLNPGSIGAPGFRNSPSYGILLIDGEKNTVKTEVKYIDFE